MLMLISRIFLFSFVISCIFDPADRILGLKMPLFACCFIMSFIQFAMYSNNKIENSSLITTAIFLIIPLLAVFNGIVFSLEDGQLGFMMYKGYLLILLLPVLCILRIDILPMMTFALTLLSILIIFTYIFVNIFPESYLVVSEIGNLTGLVIPDKRNYGGDSDYLQIYYVTSPMLVVAIAYYFSLATNKKNMHPLLCYLAMFICILAMILAGTRNNLFVAFLLPAGLIFFNSNSKSKVYSIPLLLGAGFLSSALIWSALGELLNLSEYSNSLKLSLIKDYINIFSDPFIFIFGQGLGVDIYWNARGYSNHLSELTYFEMVRNFGVLGFIPMISVLLSPIFKLMGPLPNNKMYQNMVLAYVFYLIMCFTNPNLFSSMGIVIFTSLLSYYFIHFRGHSRYERNN